MLLKTFRWSFLITIVALAVAFLYDRGQGLALAAILIVLEVSFSFDNAVVNAKIIERMSEYWQRIFLTVGVVIAVLGMRLVFPLAVVGITAHLSPVHAWHLALQKGSIHTEGSYAYILHEAHPAIAAFGGMFLLMIFLDFLFDSEKDVHWLAPLERNFGRFGSFSGVSIIVALVVLAVFGKSFHEHTAQILFAGVLGLALYIAVDGLGDYFEEEEDKEIEGAVSQGSGVGAVAVATGKAALALFLYLEVLDASFSFDGVIGSFAITSDPIIIALGLGVGALYVRSLTIYLVRKGTLSEFVYLEHGAHWAIGSLAILLMFTIKYDIPDVVTGLVGVAFIAAAFLWSARANRLEDVRGGAPASELADR